MEGAAPARSRIHPDAAAVRVDDPPDRGQPQAEALDVSNLFSAIKDFKKMGQVFRGNARTLVLDGEPDGRTLDPDREPHPAMAGAILDGILQQVFQHSLQQERIGPEGLESPGVDRF